MAAHSRKQSSSVVNAKRGEQIHCHSIAEGRFEPVLTTPGELLVTWTSAAEIEVKGPWSRLHEKASDFRKATWERRNVLDVLPTALQTETGRLELQQLCYKWASVPSRPTPALSCHASPKKCLQISA